MTSFCISITIEDSKKATSVVKACVPIATVWEAVVAFARDLATKLDALTGGRILGISISADVSLPGGLKSTATTGTDVEEGALFIYEVTGGFRTRMRVPTFLESKIQNDSRNLTVDAATTALTTLLVSGAAYPVLAVTAGNVQVNPSDARGTDIIALADAKEQFVRSRR